MFNFQGSELIIIMLLALVVLGPEKLPEAMRKIGGYVAQLKKMSAGFQEEFRSAVDEPMRELRDTANLLRDSADFRKLQSGERDEKPKSAEMADAPSTGSTDGADAGSTADPPGVPADAMSEAVSRLPPSGPAPADRPPPFSAAQRSSAAAPRRSNDGAALHEATLPATDDRDAPTGQDSSGTEPASAPATADGDTA